MEPPDVLKKVCASEDTSENWNNFFSVQVVVVSKRQAQESGSFDSTLFIYKFFSSPTGSCPACPCIRQQGLLFYHRDITIKDEYRMCHIFWLTMRYDYCCVTFDYFRGKRHLLAKIVSSLNQTNISKFNQLTLVQICEVRPCIPMDSCG